MNHTPPFNPIPDNTRAIDLHVGQQIRALRRTYSLSQEELGTMLGITFQQLQKNESGKNRIAASRLYQLCCVFGVQPEAFFYGLGLLEESSYVPDKRHIRFTRLLALAQSQDKHGATLLSAIDSSLQLLELISQKEYTMKTYQFTLTLMPAERKGDIPTLIDGALPLKIHSFKAASKEELQASVEHYAEALALPCIAQLDYTGKGLPPIWLKHFRDQHDCHFNI